MSRKKTGAGGESPPRDLPLESEETAGDEAPEEEISRAELLKDLVKAEEDRDAARSYVGQLDKELKALKEDNYRLNETVAELQERLLSATNQDAAFQAGYEKGYADAMSKADKSPAEIKKAVHGDGPITVRVAAKSVFLHASDVVSDLTHLKLDGQAVESGGSVKLFAGAVVKVASWEVVQKKGAALSVV